MYINDLLDHQTLIFFADDAFLFPVMYDINASTIELSNDLKKNMIESSNEFQS